MRADYPLPGEHLQAENFQDETPGSVWYCRTRIIAGFEVESQMLTGARCIYQVWVNGTPAAAQTKALRPGLYWLANGIMLPIFTAMMADASEARLIRTGVNKDGGYSSVFRLAMRMAVSFSLNMLDGRDHEIHHSGN